MKDKRSHKRGVSISKENIRVAATFTRDENEQLKKLADEENRSVSNLVAHIVREWLKAR
ncbi:ribbon-helix-helix domain-containing protein [Pontiella sp.]|uniref:ribbon-helix-helix domain-containing protein n=1 Tax=Pontiella sp. TaxID=2837462 RepID=UPI00356B4B9E